jgi:A/G-specific adenine glycosylase
MKRPSVNALNSQLVHWYRAHRRDLPWRKDQDPYRIWISEVMLQQTTVTAVIPYFEKFVQRFPTVHELASSKVDEVISYWAGLGYYSRARNLHKSAQALSQLKADAQGRVFPKTHAQLIELPGFGPYTARAVSSLAFEEPVGVLDGNVIRVLTRLYDLDLEWWKPAARAQLQTLADEIAAVSKANATKPSELNQALMELGATVCTPKSPSCMICPWMKSCLALKAGTTQQRPQPKPRRQLEVWVWRPQVLMKKIRKQNHVWLEPNAYAPFLKGQWLFPGDVTRSKLKPKTFQFKHSITHHDIFVQPAFDKDPRGITEPKTTGQWVALTNLKKVNPSSLIEKTLRSLEVQTSIEG